jgi:hypothetical protein
MVFVVLQIVTDFSDDISASIFRFFGFIDMKINGGLSSESLLII